MAQLDGEKIVKYKFFPVVCFSSATPSEFGKVCDAYTFQCANEVCVSLEWKCDGMDDCGDYSDEANCGEEEEFMQKYT